MASWREREPSLSSIKHLPDVKELLLCVRPMSDKGTVCIEEATNEMGHTKTLPPVLMVSSD